jgi:type II secretory pathway pseudopilin PulG
MARFSPLGVALCLVSLLLVSHMASAQPSPTERLNAQRQQQAQQQRQQQQQAQQRRVATRRLPAPCVVPDSYYPLRTCKVSSDPRECGKGWNAWASFAECCRPGNGGAFPRGCTDFNKQVECWIPCKFK